MTKAQIRKTATTCRIDPPQSWRLMELARHQKKRGLHPYTRIARAHREAVSSNRPYDGTAGKTARGFSGFIARVCVERRMMKSEFA